MSLKEMALAMYPYWLLGIFMIWATAKSKYKEYIRVDKEGLTRWARFLFIISIYRMILFKLFPTVFSGAAHNIALIPWPLTLTVFWEDACHGLPLLLLKKAIGLKKWAKPVLRMITLMMMVEFGMGHVYQGIIPAVMLSFYVPYSVKLGEKWGFGTVMLGHMLFDLTTILSVKFLLGG